MGSAECINPRKVTVTSLDEVWWKLPDEIVVTSTFNAPHQHKPLFDYCYKIIIFLFKCYYFIFNNYYTNTIYLFCYYNNNYLFGNVYQKKYGVSFLFLV